MRRRVIRLEGAGRKKAKEGQRAVAKDLVAADYVTMLESFVPVSDVIFAGVSAEVESLGLRNAADSPSNKWLSLLDSSYTWQSASGKKFSHKAIDITGYPSVMQLLENNILRDNWRSCEKR